MNADDTMKKTAKPTQHDWSRFDAMSEVERHAAAVSDPDAQPLAPQEPQDKKRTARLAFGCADDNRLSVTEGKLAKNTRCEPMFPCG